MSVDSRSSTAIVDHRRSPRRRRYLLIVLGILVAVLAINWYAVTVHMSNLRHAARDELMRGGNPDYVLELRASVNEFHVAQVAFGVGTIALLAVMAGLGGYAFRQRPRSD